MFSVVSTAFVTFSTIVIFLLSAGLTFFIVSYLMLKHKASTFMPVDRFIPTTKECSSCHNKYDIKLEDRIYKCSYCGLAIDRDYNSALNDMYYGIKKINKKYKINIPPQRWLNLFYCELPHAKTLRLPDSWTKLALT